MKQKEHINQTLLFTDAIEALKLQYDNEILPWKPDLCPPNEDRRVQKSMERLGIPILPLDIDADQYKIYMQGARYRKRRPECYRQNFIEKTVEHFVGLSLLGVEHEDLLVDIGGSSSLVPEIFNELTGCEAFSQDIIYEPGIHKNRIGSDAADIPLPDSSVDKALAACTIEHFEGITDILWMREMSRLLKENGKCVIAPLYLNSFAYCVTDPFHALQGNVKFDEGIKVYARENFNNRHGRHYSPETLSERLIRRNRNSLKFEIYVLKNSREIAESVYCKYILLISKKQGR